LAHVPSLSHHSSAAEEEQEMNTENVNRFRSEHFAPRSQPARFDELLRGDSRTYGDLENLLLSRIESFAEFNYQEDGVTSLDTGADSLDFGEFDEDGLFSFDSDWGEKKQEKSQQRQPRSLDLTVKEKKFRLSNGGQLLVEVNGEFIPATKNLSLYYDMITDQELKIMEREAHEEDEERGSSSYSDQQTPFSLSHYQTSHPYHPHRHPRIPPHELTGADMLSAKRGLPHDQLWSPTHRQAQEKKEKDDLLEKHHDFVETLCRITELKSQTALDERNQRQKRNKKKGGEEGAMIRHSHAINPHHRSFGLIFDGL
jgi:hypothetical protein